jgi:hypothetical protein
LRFTDFGPVPSPAFGAAVWQAGAWNAVGTPGGTGSPNVTTPLVDLAGAGTGAQAVLQGCDAYPCGVGGWGSDIAALFAGGPNGDCYADPSTAMLEGLAPGPYVLTLYGPPCYEPWGPVFVSLSDLSYSSSQVLDGDYLGTFDSMDLGSFGFDLAPGVDVRLGGGSLAWVTAAQLTVVEPPQVYCTAKVNSQGCAAQIAAIGDAASLSDASPFHLVASGVLDGVPGILFYGFDEDIKPFMGGFHCVQPPTPRTTYQMSGGDGTPCSGTFDQDFNAWLATQPQPEVHAGTRVFAQFWYRDPGDVFKSATSDAVSFHVVP